MNYNYTPEELDIIRGKLLEIQSRPQLINEWGDVVEWDTFWTTAIYNQENPDMPIDGYLCEYLLFDLVGGV